MNDSQARSRVKRRSFLGGTLLAAGAAIGAWARRPKPLTTTSNPSPLDSRFAYDLSEYEKFDPALLRYRASAQFQTGFDHVRRITVTPAGVWVAGDQSLKLFNKTGELKSELKLSFAAHCFHAVDDNEMLVASRDFYVRLNATSKEVFRSERAQPKSYFTAIRAHGTAIYIADAGNREVLICDRKSGDIIDRFGKSDPSRNNPGFAIPSPYFDLEIAGDRLRVANTGQTRIETYSLDGRFESAWGKPGMQFSRFCGCCNPVFFTIASNGNYITSEKGLARICIYSPDGSFLGVVAGPLTLVEEKELGRRACVDCSVGGGFDVATDSRGFVYALDPYKKAVRCFAPLEQT